MVIKLINLNSGHVLHDKMYEFITELNTRVKELEHQFGEGYTEVMALQRAHDGKSIAFIPCACY